MFGQQNDKPDDNKIPEHSIDGALKDDNSQTDAPASAPAFGHPGTPLGTSSSTQSPMGPPSDVIKPDAPQSDNIDQHQATAPPAPDDASLASGSTPHDLIDIKQKALGQLTPLVGHLDQSPEDKFRTTMMMIQASDDQSLVQTAYDAAQQITDEKTRAQALLDIVNEINYFTQHHTS